MPNITFVNGGDQVIGYGTRNEVIANKIVHRIARIFIFNSKGELLIQKRSSTIDSPNKWDQSAAGHVDQGEDYPTAAKRELEEEVGISDVPLKEIIKFYSEETDESVTKKRFNMLYWAIYDGDIKINKDEVSETRWVKPRDLEAWMQEKPEDFTRGFIQSYKHYSQHKI